MQTKNTQPSVFLYEVALALSQQDVTPDVVAGHSLGEFAALVVAGVVSFEDGLNLVLNRALIGQKACEKYPTGMGAIIGLSDEYVARRIKEIWNESGEPIYFANYNGPGQVVITGSKKGVRMACKAFKTEGAKKAVPLAIAGSFHSPYMNEAQEELGAIIQKTAFKEAKIPVYQCVDALAHTDSEELEKELDYTYYTSCVVDFYGSEYGSRWCKQLLEVGTDDTLQKIVKRMEPNSEVGSLLHIPTYDGIITDYSIINNNK